MVTKLRGLIKSLVYRIYEGRLVAKVAAGPMPRHVGIILDGNRRHGRANGLMDPERIYRAWRFQARRNFGLEHGA